MSGDVSASQRHRKVIQLARSNDPQVYPEVLSVQPNDRRDIDAEWRAVSCEDIGTEARHPKGAASRRWELPVISLRFQGLQEISYPYVTVACSS